MPVRYDQDIKVKAIRLVREHAGDHPSEYAAITAVARELRRKVSELEAGKPRCGKTRSGSIKTRPVSVSWW